MVAHSELSAEEDPHATLRGGPEPCFGVAHQLEMDVSAGVAPPRSILADHRVPRPHQPAYRCRRDVQKEHAEAGVSEVRGDLAAHHARAEGGRRDLEASLTASRAGEDSRTTAKALIEASVHLPKRGRRWIATYRDGSGRQLR